MLGGHRLRRPTISVPNPHEKLGDQVLRLIAQRPGVDQGFDRGRTADNAIEQGFGERLDKRFDRAGLRGKPSENAKNPRVVVSGQVRQQLVPEAVARIPWVVVGMVVAERLRQRLQIANDLLAGNREHRPNERRRGRKSADARNSSQPCESSAANQAVQHRFALVVRRMGERYVAGAIAMGRFKEEFESALAEPVFVTGLWEWRMDGHRAVCGRRRFAAGLPASHFAGEAKLASELSDKPGVPIGRFPAQAMVVVGDKQLTRAPFVRRCRSPQGVQSPDQGDAVGAAGNADNDREIAPSRRRPGADEGRFERAVLHVASWLRGAVCRHELGVWLAGNRGEGGNGWRCGHEKGKHEKGEEDGKAKADGAPVRVNGLGGL